MKLTELTVCNNCGGNPLPDFYVIRFSLAIMTRHARETAGVAQTLGGLHMMPLAEVFAPRPERAVVVAGDEDPELMEELIICSDCMLKRINLLEIAEKKNDKEVRETEDEVAE